MLFRSIVHYGSSTITQLIWLLHDTRDMIPALAAVKYWTLLLTSSFWYIVRLGFSTQTHYRPKCPRLVTTRVSFGYPAKFLILTSFMFYSTIWNANYFSVNATNNFMLNTWTYRHLSTYTISHSKHCTWEFLRDYNCEQWHNLFGSSNNSASVTRTNQEQTINKLLSETSEGDNTVFYNSLE